MNYYNENDPRAAAWLRELIASDAIPDGDIDTRSIHDICPSDLTDYIQCHFFAGIGGWALALRLAGWPDGRPVWTGSCPCQPFSAAGGRKGEADERHLWPEFLRLLAECQPTITFGEQVASPLGRAWLAGVRTDMEALGYAVGAADLCAAGVGAPHIRQRLFWVADADRLNDDGARYGPSHDGRERKIQGELRRQHDYLRLADASGERGAQQLDQSGSRPRRFPYTTDAAECSGPRGMGDAGGEGCAKLPWEWDQSARPGASSSPWDAYDLLPCTDGKARRVESGTFPLAHGIPGRVGLLRGYGNAIVPQLAAEFVCASEAALEMI